MANNGVKRNGGSVRVTLINARFERRLRCTVVYQKRVFISLRRTLLYATSVGSGAAAMYESRSLSRSSGLGNAGFTNLGFFVLGFFTFVSCFCVGCCVGFFAFFAFFAAGAAVAATVFAFVAALALAVTRTAATVLSFFPTATPFAPLACDFAPFLPLPATATGTAWFATKSDGGRDKIRERRGRVSCRARRMRGTGADRERAPLA